MHDVVEPPLEQRHERFTRIALPPLGTGEVGAKLTLKDTVVVLDLLLLTQTQPVVGRLRASLLHNTRGRRPPLERTLRGVAATSLEKQLEAVAAAESTNRSGDASHGSVWKEESAGEEMDEKTRRDASWEGDNRCAAEG